MDFQCLNVQYILDTLVGTLATLAAEEEPFAPRSKLRAAPTRNVENSDSKRLHLVEYASGKSACFMHGNARDVRSDKKVFQEVGNASNKPPRRELRDSPNDRHRVSIVSFKDHIWCFSSLNGQVLVERYPDHHVLKYFWITTGSHVRLVEVAGRLVGARFASGAYQHGGTAAHVSSLRVQGLRNSVWNVQAWNFSNPRKSSRVHIDSGLRCKQHGVPSRLHLRRRLTLLERRSLGMSDGICGMAWVLFPWNQCVRQCEVQKCW